MICAMCRQDAKALLAELDAAREREIGHVKRIAQLDDELRALGGSPSDGTLLFQTEVPVTTKSETNMREHWGARHSRRAKQRERIERNIRVFSRRLKVKIALPVAVKLTRISFGTLDTHDNLRSALKGCADGVADFFGVADRDPRIVWSYGQENGGKKVRRVRVEFRALTMKESA